jgi:uncharacterized protein
VQGRVPTTRKLSRRSLLYAVIVAVLLANLPADARASGTQSIALVQRVIAAARAQTQVTRFYDPTYLKLSYPGGDPPPDRGVCSDVIIRAFRAAGVDLQREIHEDMAHHFTAYPHLWGLRAPDPNIDHRRVANLMAFFRRKGKALPITDRNDDYRPGDVVAWDLGGGLLHLGIVVDDRSDLSRAYSLLHNIGAGARLEDVLFRWRIIGHYRYF